MLGSTLEAVGQAVGLVSVDDDRRTAEESFEHMKEVERRTSGHSASFYASGSTSSQKFNYWLENYVAADPNAMLKILIYVSGASIIGFGLWAAIDNNGHPDTAGDWIFAGAIEKMWFAFQMMATADYKDDIGSGYRSVFWTSLNKLLFTAMLIFGLVVFAGKVCVEGGNCCLNVLSMPSLQFYISPKFSCSSRRHHHGLGDLFDEEH